MFYMNQNSNNKSTTCIISHKETGKENQNLVLNIPASKKDKKKHFYNNNHYLPPRKKHIMNRYRVNFLIIREDEIQNGILVWTNTILIIT